MNLVIKELDFNKCYHFMKEEFGNELRFTELFFSKHQLEAGDFFTVVPDNVRVESLYEFKTGGKIYPFYRPANVTVMPVRNDGENIFKSSVIDYLFQSNNHFIGIEDYSAATNSNYIKENNLKYHLLSNGHLFYLLNNNFTPSEVLKHYWFSKGYLFLCSILKLPGNSDFLLSHKELSDYNMENYILPGTISFFIEVYDGEGYLLWVSRQDDSFLKLIKEQLSNQIIEGWR